MVMEGRKNWRVAGMSRIQAATAKASVLTTGAEGAIDSEKSVRAAKKRY